MLDAVLPEGGGRKLAFDKRLSAEENGTGRGDLAAAGVVQRQVAVDHVLSR